MKGNSCWLLAAALVSVLGTASGATYFVDSVGGSDATAGTSESAAWKSFNNINGRTFYSGDKILLKKGGVWNDTLWPLGSGVAGAPITIGVYGSTGNLPKINMAARDYGVLMRGMQYWTIESLEVAGGYPSANHSGIYIAGDGLRGFQIRNCVVHDIGGSYSIPFDRGGIMVLGANDILIEGCTVYNVHSDAGIEAGSNGNPHTSGLTVRNCTVFNNFGANACAGILPVSVDNVLVENNRVYGLDGIWTWNCTNAVMQFNEVYDTTCMTGGDGGGIHIDYYCKNNTIQYNYVHDCGGYGVCIYGADTSNLGGGFQVTSNSVIRYNIFSNNAKDPALAYQGDVLLGTFSNGWIDGAKIYNNTFYTKANHADGFWVNASSSISNSIFKNNIVVAANPRLVRVFGGVSFDNNIYWSTVGNVLWQNGGVSYTALSAWQASGQDAHSKLQDPLLANSGFHAVGWPTTQFLPAANSPAVNAGVDVGGMGSRDFLGQAIPQQSYYDIGACETGSSGGGNTGTTTTTDAKQDDSSSAVAYVGAGWFTWADSSCFGGSIHATNRPGDYFQYAFTGTGVQWYEVRNSNRGKADVYIDGAYKQTVDAYAAACQYNQLLYAISGLVSGSHTIKVVCNGQKNVSSSDVLIGLDALAVEAASSTPPPSTPPPASGANNAPVATADAFDIALSGTTTMAAKGVLINDKDADGDAMTAVLANNYTTGLGNLTLNADGSFSFTPTYGYFKAGDLVGFTYKAKDSKGAFSTEVSVLLTLKAGMATPPPTTIPPPATPPPPSANSAPVATGDNYSVAKGTTLSVPVPGLLANDRDSDGDALTAVLVNNYTTGLGNLTLNANGSFLFTPTYAYFKTGDLVGFTYKARDSKGAFSAETTVLITIK